MREPLCQRIAGQYHLDGLSREYHFDTIDATRPLEEISGYLASRVSALIEADRTDGP